LDDLFYVPCQRPGCTGQLELAMSDGARAFVHCNQCGLRFLLCAQEIESLRLGTVSIAQLLAAHPVPAASVRSE